MARMRAGDRLGNSTIGNSRRSAHDLRAHQSTAHLRRASRARITPRRSIAASASGWLSPGAIFSASRWGTREILKIANADRSAEIELQPISRIWRWNRRLRHRSARTLTSVDLPLVLPDRHSHAAVGGNNDIVSAVTPG
jgi:hypothetical protein